MTIEILRNNAINFVNDYWKKYEDINGLINGQEKEEVLGDDWEEEINSIGEEINWKELYKNERGIRSAIDNERDSLIDSINWEMPVIIENLTDEEINISDNSDYREAEVSQHFKNYNGKRVIFRNCPNLKRIEADKLSLIGLEIENCPELERLLAYNNRIEKLDLSGLKHLNHVYVPFNKLTEINLKKCDKLENLNCGNNKLPKLFLGHCSELKSLHCNHNEIKNLKVKHLINLEELFCQHNSLLDINCSGLKKLKELNCSEGVFVKDDDNGEFIELDINLEGCDSLEILDCAENRIKNLKISNFPNLNMLSCKENCLEKLTISNCPKFAYLDFSLQDLLEWNEENECWDPIAIVPTNLYIDNDSLFNLEVLYFTEEAKFLSIKNEPLAEEKLSKIKVFECSSGEVDDFEAWLDKKRRQEQRRKNFDEGYESDDDTIDASNYRIPERKDIIVSHDLSHWNLTGELIIDGWANLKSLNVGNNELNSLVVRNCPNLKRLIYAHNKMPKEAKISGCNNLTEIDKENYNGVIEWKGELSETEKARIEILKLTEEYNDKVYSILKREEQGEDIDLDELARLLSEIKNPNLIDLEYRDKFIALYYRKIKERFPEQYKKQQQQEKDQENNNKNKELVIKIANLIEKAQQALEKNDFEEVKRILNEMKSYCDTDAYANNKKIITKLEQQLINATSQSEPNNKTPNLPLIIGLSLVSIGILALVLKFLQNKLKKMLKFR